MQGRNQTEEIIAGIYENAVISKLKGSSEHIAIAEKIRKRAVAMVVYKQPKIEFWTLFNSKTSADWWIEHEDLVTYSPLTLGEILDRKSAE
jgi:hypothetical protein